MDKEGWKVLAIILMVIFFLEIVFFGFVVVSVFADDELIKECYYEICDGYDEVVYEDGVCYCYELDELGGYIPVVSEVMK